MNLEAVLAELKKEYVASLPLRMDDIRYHWKGSDFDTLKDDFHRLKGTGKTYGLPELSHIGEIGELICRDKFENIPTAMPLLIELIAAVHQSAVIQQSFDVTLDPRFSQLKKLM